MINALLFLAVAYLIVGLLALCSELPDILEARQDLFPKLAYATAVILYWPLKGL